MKYSSFLKKFVGLQVLVFDETSVVRIFAIKDEIIVAWTKQNFKVVEMVIYKVYEDFIVLKQNGTVKEGEFLLKSIPIDKVLVDFSNVKLD